MSSMDSAGVIHGGHALPHHTAAPRGQHNPAHEPHEKQLPPRHPAVPLGVGRAAYQNTASSSSCPGHRSSPDQQHLLRGIGAAAAVTATTARVETAVTVSAATASGPLAQSQLWGEHKDSIHCLHGDPALSPLLPPPPPPPRRGSLDGPVGGGAPARQPHGAPASAAGGEMGRRVAPPTFQPSQQPRRSFDSHPWPEGGRSTAILPNSHDSHSTAAASECEGNVVVTSHSSPNGGGFSFYSAQFDPLGIRGAAVGTHEGQRSTDPRHFPEPSCLLPALLSSLMDEIGPEETLQQQPAPSGIRPSPPPPHFLCPITGRVMADPVVAADGFLYEREAILDLMQQQQQPSGSAGPKVGGGPRGGWAEPPVLVLTSPVTGLPLQDGRLVPVIPLRNAIMEWRQKQH